MTVWGIIITSIFSLFVLGIAIKMVIELYWNKKLNMFKEKEHISPVKFPVDRTIKYVYSLSLSAIIVFVSVFSGVFSPLEPLGNKTLVQANLVGSESKLNALVEDYLSSENNYLYPEANMDDGLEATDGDDESRDYTDTNVQVDGVDEGDVLKTDGYRVFYAPRYYNVIEVLDIEDNHTMTKVDTIELDNFRVDSLYLTDEYLVTIGYRFEETIYPMDTLEDYWGFYFYSQTATVVVFDKDTLEEVYQMDTDLTFIEHRLIDDTLYLVSTKWFYDEAELRPQFDITLDGQTTTSYLNYKDMYYFEDLPAASMTVITSIDFNTFEQQSQGFIGRTNQVYVSESSIYTFYTDWQYEKTDDGYAYDIQTYIVKYNIDKNSKTINYVASTAVEGYVEDRYWLDESGDYLRIVTSRSWWNDEDNHLYILKENDSTDTFDLIAHMDENIGHENERVESVRFHGDYVNIVTYERMDPLYTIDLSNPENPEIIAPEIEEAGYSEYLHIWDESHHVLGLGYLDANEDSVIDGMKLSAYDTNTGTILETDPYPFETDGNWSYSYTAAMYDPKAIMVDVELGLFGFPMTKYSYDYARESYEYQSAFVVYHIDFDREFVLGEPTIIYHDAVDWYNHIDRGLYIEGYIYTFSAHQVSSYDLANNTVFETITIESTN